MRTSANRLCILSLLPVLALATPSPAQRRQRPPLAREQPCCRIEGQVVSSDGEQYGPVTGLRIVIKRGRLPLQKGYTDDSGRYSIQFERGDAINVKYGDEDKWEPSVVENISGRTDHRITKVLVLRHAGRLTNDQAGEIVSALEYMNNHPEDFAADLNKYTATLNMEEFPPEFHERLYRINQAVAARQKEKPTSGPAPNSPFVPGPTRPITFRDEASASPGPKLWQFDLMTRRFESYFSLHLEAFPPEVELLLHQPINTPQPLPESSKIFSTPHTYSFIFGFNRTLSGLRVAHEFIYDPDQFSALDYANPDPSGAKFVYVNFDRTPGSSCAAPNQGSFSIQGSRKFVTELPVNFSLHVRAPDYFLENIQGFDPVLTPFQNVLYLGDRQLVGPFLPRSQFRLGNEFIFTDPKEPTITTVPKEPATPPTLNVLGANLFSITPGAEYPLEISDPAIGADSSLAVPASAAGISVTLNNPDPTAHVLRAVVAVGEEVEPAAYHLVLATSNGAKSVPFVIKQAPPEASGEVTYPGVGSEPPRANFESAQELQAVITGKHLKGVKVEPAGETTKWIEVKGVPASSPDGRTLTLTIVVRERTPAGLYALRLSNDNPTGKTQDVPLRIGPRP